MAGQDGAGRGLARQGMARRGKARQGISKVAINRKNIRCGVNPKHAQSARDIEENLISQIDFWREMARESKHGGHKKCQQKQNGIFIRRKLSKN